MLDFPNQCRAGESCSCVLGCIRDASGADSFIDLLSGRSVKVTHQGCVPPRFSVHGAKVTCNDPFSIQIDDPSMIFPLQKEVNSLGTGLVELCAGTGSMGAGAMFLGAVPLLAWDHSALAAAHLSKNDHGLVLHAELNDLTALHRAQVHLQGQRFVGLLGFPCQPYSSQGGGRGHTDPRALVLTDALRALVFLHPQAVILECVCGASQNEFVRQAISTFCQIMDFEWHETKLNLNQQWPMSRHRWWSLLVPKEWGNVNLKAWPTSSPRPIISDVLTSFGVWPLAAEQELLPSKDEWTDFTDPRMGSDLRLVDSTMSCPTVLHSYSVTHRGCPCGCRSCPFSKELLQDKGLRGFLIRSPASNMPRYLHPSEMALLLGIPPMMKFELPERSSLCLLGNVASPMQSLWVYSHLLQGAATHCKNLGHVTPMKILQDYKNVLRVQGRTVISNDCELPQHITIHAADGAPLQVWSCGSATAAQLLKAEKITLDWGASQVLRDDLLVLDDENLLDHTSNNLVLERKVKRQRIDPPQGTLAIGIIHNGDNLFAFVEAGQFMFEALHSLGIFDICWLTDDRGTLISTDFRVWESGRYYTLGLNTFPALKRFEMNGLFSQLRAAGHHDTSSGLSADIIHEVLSQLSRQLRPKLLLLEPFEWTGSVTPALSALRFQLRVGWQQCDGMVLLPFVHEGHWWLLSGSQIDTGISWTLWDGFYSCCPTSLDFLLEYLTNTFDLDFWVFCHETKVLQPTPTSCGTVAIAHCCLALGLIGEFSSMHIETLHDWLCAHDCGHQLKATGPPDPVPHLAELLITKGVDAAHAHGRATEATQKLGLRTVQEAMVAKNPWAALKAAASKPNVAYKFVHAEELDRHIQNKAKSQYGSSFTNKPPKAKKKNVTPLGSLAVDPRQIVLADGYFEAESKPIPQIDITRVVKDAIGISVCSLQEAAPFANDNIHLSSGALALLVLATDQEFRLGYANASEIKFTARYKATEEPVLLPAWLVQLGDVEVKRRKLDDPMATEAVSSTAVVKLTIYRDEIDKSWDQICAAPIKFVFQVAPCLTLCRQTGCGPTCLKFHQAVDEDLDSVVHEVWGRRFQSMAGSATTAAKADTFQAFLRLQTTALSDTLALQVRGLYVEPRSSTTKGTHPDYAVIWLSDATAEEAVHKLRITSHALAVTRMKMRYGLRVAATHEKEVFEALRPNTDFIKVSVQMVFHLHPLPFGLQRTALVKLLREWQWTARPLQVAKGSALGGAWTVGAETQPPSLALSAFGKEVLITCVKSVDTPAELPKMMIPRRTEQHIRHSTSSDAASSTSDPWMQPHNDPWQHWKRPAVDSAAAQPVRQRITELSKEIKADMKEYLQQELHQNARPAQELPDGVEHRFSQLECGLQELQAHNVKYQGWFQEASTRMSNTEQQLQVMSTALATTQDTVHRVETDVRQHAASVASSLHAVKSELSADMSQKFDQFSEKLEALLSKKQRTDN